VQRSADGRDPLFSGGATVRLRVRLPSERRIWREPLVVTGGTGAGNLLMIEYMDATTVRFVMDPWGGPTVMSEPVQLADRGPHEMHVTLGSLEARGEAAAERHAFNGVVGVRLNGRQVWRDQSIYFSAEAEEIAIGHNPIGGTGCAPVFSGEVLDAERIAR
jgi:hypothetical protein